MFAWLRRRDCLDERADRLAATLARHFDERWATASQTAPCLTAGSREQWQQAATVAGALLTVFPLLRASGGDAARFVRLRARVLAGLQTRYPSSGALVKEAEGATIPPSGHVRTNTLHEVDETTALALAGWVVRRVGGADATARSWDDVRRVSELLRESVAGYWDGAES